MSYYQFEENEQVPTTGMTVPEIRAMKQRCIVGITAEQLADLIREDVIPEGFGDTRVVYWNKAADRINEFFGGK